MVPFAQFVSILVASAATSACVQATAPAHPPLLLSAEGRTAQAAVDEPVRYKGKAAEREALVRTAAHPAKPQLPVAPARPVPPEPQRQGEPAQAPHAIAEAAPQPAPPGAVGRILAGSVGGAYAATLPRAAAEPGHATPVLAGTPAPGPSGWKLLVCGFAILVFIALRRSRLLTG